MMDIFVNVESMLESNEDYNILIGGLINEIKDV